MDTAMHKVRVGERLRLAIEALGKTQAEVARSIGVAPNKLGNWIRGDNYPAPIYMVALAERWNITADWLLRGVIAGTASPLADALWTSVSGAEAAPKERSPQAVEIGEHRRGSES